MNMTVAEDGGIFITYRGQESSHAGDQLYDRIVERFGEGRIFIDMDAINSGVDLSEAISRAVGACKVLLAIIGPNWLTAADQRGGRLLDDPDDIVRLALEAALAREVRLIPVLVDGAVMPGRQDLPESLSSLARRRAHLVRPESFRADAGRLVRSVARTLAAAPGAAGAWKGSGPAREDLAQVAADADRAARLLADAERSAKSITGKKARALVLGDIAKALVAIEPDRAAGLVNDAERVAKSVVGSKARASAVTGMAKAQATTDPRPVPSTVPADIHNQPGDRSQIG